MTNFFYWESQIIFRKIFYINYVFLSIRLEFEIFINEIELIILKSTTCWNTSKNSFRFLLVGNKYRTKRANKKTQHNYISKQKMLHPGRTQFNSRRWKFAFEDDPSLARKYAHWLPFTINILKEDVPLPSFEAVDSLNERCIRVLCNVVPLKQLQSKKRITLANYLTNASIPSWLKTVHDCMKLYIDSVVRPQEPMKPDNLKNT